MNWDKLAEMRLMRGRVLIRQIHDDRVGLIYKPATWRDNPKQLKETSHRGRVLAMGPPPKTKKMGWEMPIEFKIGDEVIFVFGIATEKLRTMNDGYLFVSYEEIQAVIER